MNFVGRSYLLFFVILFLSCSSPDKDNSPVEEEALEKINSLESERDELQKRMSSQQQLEGTTFSLLKDKKYNISIQNYPVLVYHFLPQRNSLDKDVEVIQLLLKVFDKDRILVSTDLLTSQHIRSVFKKQNVNIISFNDSNAFPDLSSSRSTLFICFPDAVIHSPYITPSVDRERIFEYLQIVNKKYFDNGNTYFYTDGKVRIQKHAGKDILLDVDIEMPEDDFQKRLGLMFRDSLPSGKGMLFMFEEPAQRNFWMKNVSFSLDILYMDQLNRITEIQKHLLPFSLNAEPTEKDAQYVLELNAGSVDRYNINVGDSIEIIAK